MPNDILEGHILACRSCPKICQRNPYPFPAYYEGGYQKSLMIIGQSPGVEHSYKPMPPHLYLDLYKENFKRCNFHSYLNRIGIRDSDYYFTNIIKCPLKSGENVDPEYVKNCSRYLKLQFRLVQPSVVLVLSKTAGVFLNLERRHKILDLNFEGVTAKAIYSWHPTYLGNLARKDSDELVGELRSLLRQSGVKCGK